MHAYLNTALIAVRKACKVILHKLDRLDTIQINEIDKRYYVTDVDKEAEALIIETIKHAYPEHSIIAELNGEIDGDPDQQWIIDPLDGITNFIHGYPHFCVSVAFKRNDILEHGLIYDPIRQELFTASKGRGAYLNDKRIRVSECQSMRTALIGTGLPERYINHLSYYLKTFACIFNQAGGIRHHGSIVLDLAYVAAGRLDGFWELKLEPWDVAATTLLIQEAGGLISSLQGEGLEKGDVVAGNPRIYKQLIKSIQGVLID